MDFEQKPTSQPASEVKETGGHISRRDFLKLVGGGIGFVVLNGCGVKPTSERESSSTETAGSEEFVPREKITELDDLLRCTDKEHSVPVENMLHDIREKAKDIGYIGYPNKFQFRVAGGLSRFKEVERDPSMDPEANTNFVEDQIKFWKTLPSSQGEVKFTNFRDEYAQKYREFIFGATGAVWGTDKYLPFHGEIELKDQWIGAWDRIGHVSLGVPPEKPLSSSEGRELAANIALHEVVVGHGMDPFLEIIQHGGPYRFCDMRDVLRHRQLWFSVSESAKKFLSVVGGPELSRQEAYDAAKQSLSNDTLDQLKAHTQIYYSLSAIGELLGKESPELFADLNEVERTAVQSAIKESESLGVKVDHKNAAMALLTHNKLQQLNLENLHPSTLVNRLNWVLWMDVRQEKEMLAEVMRHVLNMEKSPSPVVESEFKALEDFVQESLRLFGTGKTLSQARTDLEAVMDSYIT
jgi:hypothetical protein